MQNLPSSDVTKTRWDSPKDRDIRRLILSTLEPPGGSRVVEELALLRGEIRVDIAIVSSVLDGFEIKSERDTLARLPRQGEIFARIFEHMTLVMSPRHLARAQAMVPDWWGLWLVQSQARGFGLHEVRAARANPCIDLGALLQLLWKEEAVCLLRYWCDEARLERKSRLELCQSILSLVPAEEIKRAVVRTLVDRREWRGA